MTSESKAGMPSPGQSPESVEPDYDSAADAWLALESVQIAMRLSNAIERMGREYGERLIAEKAGDE